MYKFTKFICQHKKLIIFISLLLIIPSILGMALTRINYDILVYLPDNIETIEGQKIMTDEFGMGGYSIILLDNMPTKEVIELEEEIKKIDNVGMAISLSDVVGEEFPVEMLPDKVIETIYKDGATLMFVTFKDGISSDTTLQTIETLRKITDERCKISGMSGFVLDTKNLSNSEIAVYVVIAVIFCLLILEFALDSYFAPILLLLNIGIAILYNMGTNIFLGEISYITKAISSVLQLGVTMDFAIFLYHSYMQEKEDTTDNDLAMSKAIGKTISSVVGSSLTTIAGFLALCSMNLTLGKDIGIVMAKGVLFGVICVVTILPAVILCFNDWIEKTKHKKKTPDFSKITNFIMKHYKAIILLFIIVLPIAFYGYKNTEVYYNLDKSMPQDLPSSVANNELKEKYDMVSTEVILIDKNLDDNKVNEMLDRIDNLEGMKWSLGLSKTQELGIPKDMLPDEIKEKFQNDKYQMIIINSKYEMATDELNNQVNEINKIIKEYDENAILAGEGPLMKDMVEISDHDFKSVNVSSIAVIFLIMIFVLKSGSLPVILICVIEFAIFINMGIPYYTKTILPFIATIVIGTIQLGATIDYAILITNKYLRKRKSGLTKEDSIRYAVETSIGSIIISGLCFFGATFGVGIYSKIEMIGSLCNLMARGAIISMLVVIFVLPAFLMMFDKLIIKTTKDMKEIKN